MEKSKPISGIYKIKNIITNKFYIGSTINFKVRFNDHKKLLRNNKHNNSHLQNSWNKHGEKNFIFEILELNTCVDLLLEREQYYLDVLMPWDNKKGYNICKIAGNTLGTKRSEDEKVKMSLSKLPNNEKLIKKLINIANDINNNDLYLDANEINYKIVDINNSFYNKKHSEETKKIMSEKKLGEKNFFYGTGPMLGKTQSDEAKKLISNANSGKNNPNSKPVLQYDTNMNLIKEWDSGGMAARILGVGQSCICRCCNNKSRTAFGFIWKYKQ